MMTGRWWIGILIGIVGVNVSFMYWMPDSETAILDGRDQSGWPSGNSTEQRGFVCKLYTDEKGQQHRYVVYVPYQIPEDTRPPLILYLNGAGESGFDGIAPLKNGLAPVIWETSPHFSFVVVFVQSHEKSWTAEGPDTERALAIMQKTAEVYHTNPDRMYLTGLSMGGSGTWSIAAKHPDLFAAIAPMSASGHSESMAHIFAEAHMPIWSFYVSGDKPDLVESNRMMFRSLLNAGASPLFTEVDDKGHNSWDYAYNNSAFFSWLSDQKRSTNAKHQQSFVLLINDRELTGWKAYGSGTWSVDDDNVLLSEGRSNQDAGYLATKRSYRDFELHLEFQLVSAKRCNILFRSGLNGKSVAGWKVSMVPSDEGSGGLFGADETCFVTDNPIAQRALRPHKWNDLRIFVEGDHVTVRLNGWKIIDFQDKRLDQGRGVIALEAPTGEGTQIRWRYVRIRELEKSA